MAVGLQDTRVIGKEVHLQKREFDKSNFFSNDSNRVGINHARNLDEIYIAYVLKIQSFQSQREICTILSCATNLDSIWFYRAIMTYLVKNDSENSEISTKDSDNGF